MLCVFCWCGYRKCVRRLCSNVGGFVVLLCVKGFCRVLFYGKVVSFFGCFMLLCFVLICMSFFVFWLCRCLTR